MSEACAHVHARRNRVKFWFIKNYMSPQMKRFVPHMAKQYGFEYEFVTYKWPSWLHKQVRGRLNICRPVFRCIWIVMLMAPCVLLQSQQEAELLSHRC